MFKDWEEMGTKASAETPKLNARAQQQMGGGGGGSALGDKTAELSEPQEDSTSRTASEQHLRFPQHHHKI